MPKLCRGRRYIFFSPQPHGKTVKSRTTRGRVRNVSVARVMISAYTQPTRYRQSDDAETRVTLARLSHWNVGRNRRNTTTPRLARVKARRTAAGRAKGFLAGCSYVDPTVTGFPVVAPPVYRAAGSGSRSFVFLSCSSISLRVRVNAHAQLFSRPTVVRPSPTLPRRHCPYCRRLVTASSCVNHM